MKVISMSVLFRLLSIFLFLILPFQQVNADDRLNESRILVNRLITHIIEAVEGEQTPETIRAETEVIIDTYFDYPLIARFAAGNAWRSASQSEREDYLVAFREVLLTLAETQFDYLKNLEYTSGEVTPKGPKLAIVSGMVHDKTGEFPDAQVSWRVSTPEGKKPRIIDIEVENISMLITQQQENTAIINSNGGSFQALIDSLKDQAEKLRLDAANNG